jgi:hypothetical protein
MTTLKVVTDPTTPGRYLGVYHWRSAGTFNVGVATSTDLRTWTYRRTVDTAASQPYLAFSPSPKNGPILADEASSPSHLRFKYWATVAGFLGTTAAYNKFDAPRTLSTCAEGTPSIRTVTYQSSASTITSGSAIVVAHHYFQDCKTDREAVGTLTNFSHWTTHPAESVDARLSAAGAVGKHGDRDMFPYGGNRWELFEGGVAPASGQSMKDWRLYLYNADTAETRQLKIVTAKGSTAFANPSATILPDPAGDPSLLVSVFLPSGAAAAGEAGQLVYWQPLNSGPGQ